ncbi:sugar ABC transporter substrate-binding protein [Pleomorphomonas carboxyditropha]|uniref:Periplasmic binding protein domain-containing protein n=1 Tax=Pleomorphomonas carboxyditropha TaxID=2023338 RepID=A0A2G9WWZ7_9HYPH|nr:sugar ABC transporter substrate-binding protein [Pleomorphomonas carboxyditropha]PIO99235.1 hypothetical protein CJ014_10260 [Pleomorphomonas carboxyditropha]
MKVRKLIKALLAASIVAGVGLSPAAAADKVKIGLVLKTMTTPYWQAMIAGAQDVARENDVDLVMLAPPTEDAVEQQINMFQDVLSQNPAVMIFAPTQPPTAINIMEKAKAQKVPVVLVDTPMPEGFDDYATFVGMDNMAIGRVGGEALAKVLKKGDKVILLEGAPGNPTNTERCNGAEEVLKAAGMVIAARQPTYNDRERAFSVTQNILQGQSDIAGAFGADFDKQLGAKRAFTQSGKDVPIVGVYATDEVLRGLLNGELYASVHINSYDIGQQAVKAALDVIAGKDVPKRLFVDAMVVTKDNAQAVLDQAAKYAR